MNSSVHELIQELNAKDSWQKELDKANSFLLQLFICGNTFGILSYIYFDYISLNHVWKEYAVYRLFVAIFGLVCLYLFRTKKISSGKTVVFYLLVNYIFLAFSASMYTDHEGLNSCNYSVSFAGLIAPAIFIIIDYRKILFLNFVFLLLYGFFYTINSSVSLTDLLLNGGTFILISVLLTPFISYFRYMQLKNQFKLKTEISVLNRFLEDSNKMLKISNHTKDKFFSIISHDLRSPFSGIMGIMELLHDDYDNFTDFERKSHISRVLASIRSSYNLLDNLLVWSRVQNKKITLSKEKVLALPYIENSIKAYQPLAASKNISVVVDVAKDLEIVVDTKTISTVLINLFSNAIKFTNKGGEIKIDTVVNEGVAYIGVSDNGVGISKNKLVTLFDITETKTSLGTNNEKGSGIGLSLCKDFVEVNGGLLKVESELNKGTVFTVSLPQ